MSTPSPIQYLEVPKVPGYPNDGNQWLQKQSSDQYQSIKFNSLLILTGIDQLMATQHVTHKPFIDWQNKKNLVFSIQKIYQVLHMHTICCSPITKKLNKLADRKKMHGSSMEEVQLSIRRIVERISPLEFFSTANVGKLFTVICKKTVKR